MMSSRSAKSREASFSNLALGVATSSVNTANMAGKLAMAGRCYSDAACRETSRLWSHDQRVGRLLFS